MTAQWLYLGCGREAGHYLFMPGMRHAWGKAGRDLSRFDGILAPQDTTEGYIAVLSRLPGWGVSALSFWDYTVDKRGGSNSTFFAPSLTITADELIAGAKERFPGVWARLPPVTVRGE